MENLPEFDDYAAVPRRLPPWWADFLFVLAVLVIFALVESKFAVGGENYFERMDFFVARSLAFMLAVAAPLLFLPQWLSRLYSWTVIPLVLAATSAQIVLLVFYVLPVEKSLISIFAVSSPGECAEFARATVAGRVGAVALIAFLLIVTTSVLSCRLKRPPAAAGFWCGLLALLPLTGFCAWFALNGEFKEIFNHATLPRIGLAVAEYRAALRPYAEMASNPAVPPGLSRRRGVDPFGVVVIGESATRSHHSLFGYSRPTTPELDALRAGGMLFAFDNVLSPTVHTATALPLAFSFAELGSNLAPGASLASLLRRAGFRVVLLSNQLRWGEFDTPVNLLFREADRVLYIRENADRRTYDDELLDALDCELNSSGPVMVFLHLMGSHSPFEHRVPSGSRAFSPAAATPEPYANARFTAMANAYDSSIFATDRLLGKLTRRLTATGRPAFWLYFSDHGEAVYPEMTEWIARDAGRRVCYEVPLAIWFSSAYRSARPGLAAGLLRNCGLAFRTDRLLYAVLDLAGVAWPGFPWKNDLCSEHFQPMNCDWRELRNAEYPPL